MSTKTLAKKTVGHDDADAEDLMLKHVDAVAEAEAKKVKSNWKLLEPEEAKLIPIDSKVVIHGGSDFSPPRGIGSNLITPSHHDHGAKITIKQVVENLTENEKISVRVWILTNLYPLRSEPTAVITFKDCKLLEVTAPNEQVNCSCTCLQPSATHLDKWKEAAKIALTGKITEDKIRDFLTQVHAAELES